MGIRPGDLKLSEGESNMSVTAKVEVIEALGNETIIYANLDKDAEAGIEKTPTSITVSAKLKKNPDRKSIITLALDEESIHIFDKATETSIRK